MITSGFSEIGRRDLEDELLAIARRHGMRILGPNIVGIMSNSDKLNASFAPFLPFPGSTRIRKRPASLCTSRD